MFDLKGSTTGRMATKEDIYAGKVLYKDLDVLANQVFFTVGRERKRQLIDQVMECEGWTGFQAKKFHVHGTGARSLFDEPTVSYSKNSFMDSPEKNQSSC